MGQRNWWVLWLNCGWLVGLRSLGLPGSGVGSSERLSVELKFRQADSELGNPKSLVVMPAQVLHSMQAGSEPGNLESSEKAPMSVQVCSLPQTLAHSWYFRSRQIRQMD